MWCAYLFTLLALVSAPSAFSAALDHHHRLDRSDLPPAGAAADHHRRQNIQAAAADARSQATI